MADEKIMDDEEYVEIITLTDEDGTEYELALMDDFSMEGRNFSAFMPVEPEDGEDEDGDLVTIILERTVGEDGEEEYSDIEDDDELQTIFDFYVSEILEKQEEQ